MSCPEGIVLAADRRIIFPGNIFDDIDKIYEFSTVQVGGSYWGLATISGRSVLDHLSEFERTSIRSGDDVNSISEKLKSYLENLSPKIKQPMGIHVAGYCKELGGELYPQLRHIFHVSWHRDGEFTNEDSNREYHLENGTRISHAYEPFIALFNGDYAVANALFLFLPTLSSKSRRQIILDLLSLAECIGLARLIIHTSSDILNYLFTLYGEKAIEAVYGINIATITKEDGFRWIEKR